MALDWCKQKNNSFPMFFDTKHVGMLKKIPQTGHEIKNVN